MIRIDIQGGAWPVSVGHWLGLTGPLVAHQLRKGLADEGVDATVHEVSASVIEVDVRGFKSLFEGTIASKLRDRLAANGVEAVVTRR